MTKQAIDPQTEAVVRFWFADGMEARHFKKDPKFDAEIAAQFAATYAQASTGQLDAWCKTARGALALIIVLDQFPRNMFRDTPQAFASDARALAASQQAIADGFDAELPPAQCRFLYMPFMHSEDLAIQEKSLALFEKLGLEKTIAYAIAHRDIIARFGRFPHRNAILGRATTPQEAAFLTQPDSSF